MKWPCFCGSVVIRRGFYSQDIILFAWFLTLLLCLYLRLMSVWGWMRHWDSDGLKMCNKLSWFQSLWERSDVASLPVFRTNTTMLLMKSSRPYGEWRLLTRLPHTPSECILCLMMSLSFPQLGVRRDPRPQTGNGKLRTYWLWYQEVSQWFH